MPKTYITFGQVHVHSINGKTFDKDCIAVINCTDKADGRAKAFEFFDGTFHNQYHENEWKPDKMLPYFPRGLIEVNDD